MSNGHLEIQGRGFCYASEFRSHKKMEVEGGFEVCSSYLDLDWWLYY